jgi:hypothetical protein
MGIEAALDDLDRRLKRVEHRTMDAATKKVLGAMLTIVQQLANQTYSTAEVVLQSLPEGDPRRGTLADVQQSRIGLLRRLTEVIRQVDQA